MEKIKEFISSPKKTALLGLIGSFIYCILTVFYFSPYAFLQRFIYNINIIGLIVYFLIACLRLFKKSGNIKIASYILVITFVIQLVLSIKSILHSLKLEYIDFNFAYYVVSILIELSIFVVSIIFFIKTLILRKKGIINNKIFASVMIISSIFYLMHGISIITILYYLAFLSIVPYFYNYYNLLKGENTNGK